MLEEHVPVVLYINKDQHNVRVARAVANLATNGKKN